jgi:NAD(P)-dependent dehydrogenase (short-subunit alcohol dehydrogenase family)
VEAWPDGRHAGTESTIVKDFGGKTAVVTGAASGIGRATAKALADAGASVTLLDVNDELGGSAAEAAGGTYVHLDVSNPDEWRALFATFDRLDLLHLNAGIYDISLKDITTISDARYRAYTGVNVDGVFFGLREAIPLLEQAQGAVVVTSSMAGLVPLPGNPVYALTKWALIGLVRSIHGDLERRGIRINALCPGAVATPLMGDDPRTFFDGMGITAFEPEDLAATVIDMLASDRSGQAVLHRPPWAPETFEFARLPEH